MRVAVIAVASVVSVAVVAHVHGQAPAADRDEGLARINEDIRSFFKQHCNQCHGKDKQEGKAAFHELRLTSEIEGQAKFWQQIADKLESRVMPPEDEPQPTGTPLRVPRLKKGR